MTMTEFVNDPDSPLALVSASSGHVLHTTSGLTFAKHIAGKMVRGEWDGVTRQRAVIIHKHNGLEGWEAGTTILETVSR